jgi:D-amino peptidase
MTAEVVAACEGAIAAGAAEILLKDAHGSGRNILGSRLPECVRLIRGWSGHPLCMVQELDDSFDGIVFLGYHSKGGTDGNPLAHTLSLKVHRLAINGETASELLMHSLAAGCSRCRSPSSPSTRGSAPTPAPSIRTSEPWR